MEYWSAGVMESTGSLTLPRRRIEYCLATRSRISRSSVTSGCDAFPFEVVLSRRPRMSTALRPPLCSLPDSR